MKTVSEALGMGNPQDWPVWLAPMRNMITIRTLRLGVNVSDILGEGMYLQEEYHKLVLSGFVNAGYPHVCNDEVGYIIADRIVAVSPEGHCGLMYTMAEDDPHAYVWVTFDMSSR